MKILQLTNPVMPFPPKTIGGTERVVQYLVEQLAGHGHDVTVMCHNDSVFAPGIKVIPIGTYLDQKRTARTIWKHLLFNRYDVIHNHGRLLYFLPATWSKTRKVHTFHMADLESKSFYRFLKLKPRNLTFSPVARWIQEKYARLPGNWQYVNNGIPLNAYSFIDQKPAPNAPLVIICRLGPGKGVVDAIEIAQKTNKKLIIAGKVGDYPQEIQWYKDNVEHLCDGKQIQFIGTVDDQQKQALLSNAAGLLMLSADSDAFNLTLLEANACGCPVISYNRFFPPDFIKNGVNGFIGDTQDDLVKAVNKLNTIVRANCRQEFENGYTARIMADNYLRLYRSKV